MKAAQRHGLAPALAAAILGLCLAGCGSHHNDGPNLHGAGSPQDNPSPAPATDSGNHAGTTTSGTAGPTTTGNSTSTRATPGSNGFLPQDSGGGLGSVLGTTPRP
jgi:hypothetical protein